MSRISFWKPCACHRSQGWSLVHSINFFLLLQPGSGAFHKCCHVGKTSCSAFLMKVGTSLYPVCVKVTYSSLFFSYPSFGATHLRLFLSLYMNSMLHTGSQHARKAMSQGDFGTTVSELWSSLKFIVKMRLIPWLCYLPAFLC